MKHKKNIVARIVAGIALFAIILGIVGTGILVIFDGLFWQKETQQISEEELQQYLENLSGTTLSGTQVPDTTSSGITQ